MASKELVFPEVDYEYICRMEDVLDLYEEPLNEKKPVVCFDETPVQLVDDVLAPIAAVPGRVKRRDYRVRKEWSKQPLCFCTALGRLAGNKSHRPENKKRFCRVHEGSGWTNIFPRQKKLGLSWTDLNTHRLANLYETFEPEEARRIIKKLEVRHTPKHASWLNMAEIEISVLGGQCLKRRIGSKEVLGREVAAYVSDLEMLDGQRSFGDLLSQMRE